MKLVFRLTRSLAFVTTLFLASVALAGPEETWTQAASIYEQALAREHGWSVTQPLIQAAREAAAAGDEVLAQELADRALVTAEQALKQAEVEESAWRSRVVGR